MTEPNIDEAPGWFVTDPDGNIVDSGKISQVFPDASLAGLIDSAKQQQVSNDEETQ